MVLDPRPPRHRGRPFGVPDAHPTRLEALAYYRGVAERFGVRVVAETAVQAMTPRPGGGLTVQARGAARPGVDRRPAAVLATGFFRNPLRLRRAGRRSAARRTPLRLGLPVPWPRRRRGRREELGGRGRARPLPARRAGHARRRGPGHLRAGQVLDQAGPREPHKGRRVPAFFSAPRRGDHSRGGAARDAGRGGEAPRRRRLPADRLRPDFALLRAVRHPARGAARVPAHDPETLGVNVPGLYLAGAILGGERSAASSSRTAATTRR